MHDQPFYGSLAISFVAALVLVGGEPSRAHALDDEILICSMMHAKQMPSDFQVKAMKFTGPSGDGRRGSAGFVVQTKRRSPRNSVSGADRVGTALHLQARIFPPTSNRATPV